MRTLIWGHIGPQDQDPVVEQNLEKGLQNMGYEHFILDIINVQWRAFN